MKYKNIIWDWNGTLLNDVEISLATLNEMLTRRHLQSLSLSQYRELFGFPVRDYYENIGFNFERDDWDDVSLEYVETYNCLVRQATLTENIPNVLTEIQQAGIRQYVLSALQEDLLHEMLHRYAIRTYFSGVCGANNIYADGKISRGKEMLRDYSIIPSETLMIGDTLHDAEVAQALGLDIYLFSGGHNSLHRLQKAAPVLTSMEELLKQL